LNSFKTFSIISGDNLQPLYSITGEQQLLEIELDHLEGYLGNRPVRIGNKAYEQVQFDVYGQVLVGVMPLYTDRRLTFSKKSSYKKIVGWLLKQIERTRNMEDAGLWSSKSKANSHLHIAFSLGWCKSAYKICKQFSGRLY
jgi:glucoamylase